MLITTNAPTSRPALGSEPLCPVLASSEELAHSISVSEAMSTAAARCQQGALVVLEKDFVAKGGGVSGAAYSTGRGERYIFRLLIQFLSCSAPSSQQLPIRFNLGLVLVL